MVRSLLRFLSHTELCLTRNKGPIRPLPLISEKVIMLARQLHLRLVLVHIHSAVYAILKINHTLIKSNIGKRKRPILQLLLLLYSFTGYLWYIDIVYIIILDHDDVMQPHLFEPFDVVGGVSVFLELSTLVSELALVKEEAVLVQFFVYFFNGS